MVRKSFLVMLALFLIFVIISEVSVPPVLQALWALLSGWIFAANRLWIQANYPWPPLAGWMAGLMVFIAGTHWFCVWARKGSGPLKRSESNASNSEPSANRPSARWSWRWSLGLIGGCWLSLLGGMSLIGMVHQAAWMKASGIPMVVDRYRAKIVTASSISRLATWVEQSARSNHWNTAATRAAYWKSFSEPGQGERLERIRVLFLDDDQGKIEAIILVDGMPVSRGVPAPCMVVKPGEPSASVSGEPFPDVLRRLTRKEGSP